MKNARVFDREFVGAEMGLAMLLEKGPFGIARYDVLLYIISKQDAFEKGATQHQLYLYFRSQLDKVCKYKGHEVLMLRPTLGSIDNRENHGCLVCLRTEVSKGSYVFRADS